MAFDLQQFTDTAYEDAFESEYTLIPEGEYVVNITDLEAKPGALEDQKSVMLTLKLSVNDDAVKQLMSRDPYIWNYVVFCDVNDDWQLVYGKNQNLELGRIRKALRMNNPGKPFSIANLIGSDDMRVQVTHKTQKKDPSKTMAIITAWGPND